MTSTRSRGEALGDLELVARAEADARGLLAVAQRGVEDEDPIEPAWSLLGPSGPERGGRRDDPRDTKPSPAGSAGEGFELPVAIGLAAHDPLSRPAKGELEEAEELQGPSAHGPQSLPEGRPRVKRRAPRAAG